MAFPTQRAPQSTTEPDKEQRMLALIRLGRDDPLNGEHLGGRDILALVSAPRLLACGGDRTTCDISR